MSSDAQTSIKIRGLSKAYSIPRRVEEHATFAEMLLAKARRPFRRAESDTYWALRDVELEFCKGDVIGIVGRNGAGKSTLLKILSRITEPTAGRIELFGRVGSLLEVGTGFHGDLTGRENIFLNGAILGMARREIRRQFDAIVDFAGVETFLDTPVKRYSSGMYVRLAFAVAAHLDCDILIVDEVLAVGDAEFQQKCMGKMHEVAGRSGKTVLLVSHNIGSIQQLCNRVLYLRNGEQAFFGPADAGIRAYSDAMKRAESGNAYPPGVLYDAGESFRADAFSVRKLEVLDACCQPLARVCTGDDLIIRMHIHAPADEPLAAAEIVLKGPDGTCVSRLTTRPDRTFELPLQAGDVMLDCAIQNLPLSAGTYGLSANLTLPGIETLFNGDALMHLEVHPRDVFNSGCAPTYERYAVTLQHEWRRVV